MVRHSSRINLSQSALQTNFNFIRKKVGKDVIISSVVKANAYGHGIHEFVPMAEKCGINHFSVASSFEAEEVLEVCSKNTHIMIMGILYKEDIPWAVEHGIEFYVFNYDRLEIVKETAQKLNKKAVVHLEVETGANRTGLNAEDFSKALRFLKDNQDYIQFEGLCTHLGGAETLANKFKIDTQIERYNTFLDECKALDFMPRLRHMASSAAALAFEETRFDMVRIGVAQYGFWPSPDIRYLHMQQTEKISENGLRRIFTWKTDVMDLRKVKAGEFVGYGTAFQAVQETKIAVLPLGYSNGYPRALSNRGQVLIKGKKAPIVGLINMNLFMVNISHIPDVNIGDEVVLVGRQKNNVINVSSFTDTTQLLNNEMLSRLPAAIPRKAVP
ncbi:alanine racemase [Fulvivirga ulvae]|uniref:alanine racemase n=1 Tax=Fulvivirga ulvae TaxID=2904245 RepID=UPI001F27E97F|nr:alanine racemase [Fulvivirga ulvae]UII29734.1 alanine racemase [Fulvivirga ulvae]